MGKPRKIHLASQCYIRQFAVADFVTLRNRPSIERGPNRRVSSVGWRPGWWGSDAALAVEVERLLRVTEDKAAPVLREIDERWPLGEHDRAQLAQFVAIHVVRGPAWRHAYEMASMNAIGEELRRKRYGGQVERMAVTEFFSDPLRAQAMLKDIPRIASILMSMCWAIVGFREPLLGGCDQPVVWYPLLAPQDGAPIAALPRSGFMDTIEVRFPINPARLLLLSWAQRPDLKDIIDGEFCHAADVNRSTYAQTDRDWFHQPDTLPPFLSPPRLDLSCEPLSYDLIDGYSFRSARMSPRRAGAVGQIGELIASGTTSELRFIRVTQRASMAQASPG